MDALVIHAPGDLRVEDVPTPEVGPGQLRVRVRAGGICGSDLHYFQHGGFGTIRIKEPMVLGHEVAGVIDEVGDEVRGFVPGERIAVQLINKGLVDLKPLISASLPYRDAGRAFALAADRSQAMKVLLNFDD